MSHDSKNFNRPPYYDDFDQNKKFLRLLFRPGYAVQARELTQLQTILQNQIERVGDHLFEDGSKIIGGDITITNASFVRFDKLASDGTLIDPTEWIGFDIINNSTNTRAKVISVDLPYSPNDDYFVFSVQVTRGSDFAGSFTSSNPSHTKTIFASAVSSQISDATNINGATGITKIVSINGGVFYTDGFFIQNDAQSTSPYGLTGANLGVRDYTTPNSTVGFQIDKQTISSDSDPTLRDPANGSYNYNAPGSDRYKIDLNLTNNAIGVVAFDNKTFIDLAKFKNGKLTRKIKYTSYGVLEDALARRSYDESGSFVVRSYPIEIKEHNKTNSINGVYNNGDNAKLVASLGSGKSYIFGYEFETQSPILLDINKCRGSNHISRSGKVENANFQTGTYFYGTPAGVTVGYDGVASTVHGFADLVSGAGSTPDTAENGLDSPVKIRFYGITGAVGSENYANAGTALLYSYLPNRPEDSTDDRWRFYITDIRPGIIDPTAVNAGLQLDISSSSIAIIAGPNDTQSFPIINHSTGLAYDEGRYFADIVPQPQTTILQQRNIPPNLLYELPIGSLSSSINSIDYQSYRFFETGNVTRFNDNTNQMTINLNTFGVPDSHRFASGPLNAGSAATTLSNSIKENFYTLGFSSNNKWTAASTSTTIVPTTANSFAIGSTDWTFLLSDDARTLTVRGPNTDLTENNNYYLYATMEVSLAQLDTQSGNSPTASLLGSSRAKTPMIGHVDTFVATNPFFDEKSGDYYLELTNADAYSISSITDNGLSVLDDFIFDNGQRDVYYDYARLYIKSNVLSKYVTVANDGTFTSAYNTLIVTYDFYRHEGTGPVVVNSYSNFEDIQIYTSPITGKSTNLANCIDFRGIRDPKISTTSDRNPIRKVIAPRNLPSVQNDILTTDHDYYLGRIDKVVLTKRLSDEKTTFEVLQGIPSLTPTSPTNQEDSLVLYHLIVPPYTFNPDDVKIKEIENKRFTMEDIGKLENRIDDIEYFASLSDLEKDTLSKTLLVTKILDTTTGATGEVEGFKNAILVDSYRGHGIGDVGNNDYRCSIDFEKGVCRPSFLSTQYNMEVQPSDNTGYTVDANNILRQDHTTVELISQNYASTTVNANPFAMTNWLGVLDITPYGDDWFDINNRPSIKVNTQGESDAWRSVNYKLPNAGKGFGSQWNDWQSIWYGIEYTTNTESDEKIQQTIATPRTKKIESNIQKRFEDDAQIVSRSTLQIDERKNNVGINIKNIPDRIKKIVDGRIIDVSVVPFIRNQQINIDGKGLKPDSSVHCFFDGINVDDFCTWNGTTGPFPVGLSGDITGIKFDVPSGVFTTGEKLFRLIDNINNDVEFSITSADATFFAEGVKRNRDSGIRSIRPNILRRQSNSSERVVKDMFTRNTVFDTSANLQFIDPLTQTFFVDQNAYSNGVLIDNIEVYFSTKSNDLPISLQLRPTINSTAHASIIIPFSEVLLHPDEVNTNDSVNGPITPTRFQFKTPVFLQPGEYAMCFVTNTDEYELYAGEVGGIDIITRNYINSDPYTGVMHESQNVSVSTPILNKDIMFSINRCTYSNQKTNVIVQNQSVGTSSSSNMIFMNFDEFAPAGTSLLYTVDGIGNVLNSTNVHSSENITIQPNTNDFRVNVELKNNNVIAPFISLGQSSTVFIENIVGNGSSDEVRAFSDDDGRVGRYISRRVNLNDIGNTNQIQVILSVNKPSSTNINVYLKGLKNGSSEPFDEIPYTQLINFVPTNIGGDSLNTYTSSTKEEYRDFYFKIPDDNNPFVNTDDNIRSFAIKVVMETPDTKVVPSFKNLRAVALTTP